MCECSNYRHAAMVNEAAAEQRRLRDQFAAAALTGLLAGFQNGKSCDSYAAEAYEVADAMLRARQPTE
jgi:hypothetical protein